MQAAQPPRPRNPPALRNGGLNCLLRSQLDKYIHELKQLVKKSKIDCRKISKASKEEGWSVKLFYDTVMEDPPLRMCLQAGLDAIPPGGMLHGESIEGLCDHLVVIIKTPPKCTYSSLDGVPFYTLFCDLLETKGGMGFFLSQLVNKLLKDIFGEYAAMLQSPKSLKWLTPQPNGGWLYEDPPNTPKDKLTKPTSNQVDYSRYDCDTSKKHYGFKSWMDWFDRKIKPSKNTLPKNDNENMIVSSSDSFPLYYPYPVIPNAQGQGFNPTFNVQMESQFWLKDMRYSLNDMLGGKEKGLEKFIEEHFVGGTVYQAFLNPWCYHRWQSPISGTIKHSYKLGGTYYLQNPTLTVDIRRDNYVETQPMLSAVSVRQVYIIEADNKNIDHVAVIEIGMAEVSSCNSSVKQGEHIKKGGELGFFAFGGSSYVMIFSNRLKQKALAKSGEWYMEWSKAISDVVLPDGPGWQYELPAPGKIYVNEEVLSIVKKK